MKKAREFKDIPGYEGKYQISRDGVVRTIVHRKCVIKPRLSKHGYWHIVLYKNKKPKTHMLSALLLMTFVGPRPYGFHGAHCDGNKTNNCLRNLAWKSPADNYLDRALHGRDLPGERNGFSKLTNKQAEQIRKEYRKTRVNRSNSPALARKYNVSRATILNVINGKTYKELGESV